MMMLRLESEHRWIGHEEFGDLFMYDTKYDVYLGLKTFDDLKRVLDIIDEHGCYITTFSCLNNTNGFRIEIKKDDSCDDDKAEKAVMEDDKESLMAVSIASITSNVGVLTVIVRGDRNKVIEVVAKYFKEIVNTQDIHWKMEIPLKTFDEKNWANEITPTEKICSDKNEYLVKVRKIEEGSFTHLGSSSPEWVTFYWSGKDMEYLHSLLMPDVMAYTDKK